MKTLGMFLAVLLLVAAPGYPQDQPDKPQDVMLSVKASSLKESTPQLTLSGTANFREGTALNITLERLPEQLNGTKLIARSEVLGGRPVEVQGKKFHEELPVPGPAPYLIHVTIADEFLKESLKKSLKNIPVRVWHFKLAGWGDDVIHNLGPKLLEIDSIAREALTIVEKVEKVAGSESSYVQERKKVENHDDELKLTKEAEAAMKETAKLIARIEKADLKTLFPASYGELTLSIGTMYGNAQHFHYENGKFAGAKSYHSGTTGLKDHTGQPFSFDNVKKYLQQLPSVSGREFSLWIVKDLRRTGCRMRSEITDALKTYGKRPGIDFIAERLAQATAGDLDAFENEIRGTLNDKKSDAKEAAVTDQPPPPPEWTCPLCKKKNRADAASCAVTKNCKGKRPQ